MNKMIKITMLGAVLAFGGCALLRQAPSPGDPLPVVIQKMGQPTASYPEPGGGQELEYTLQPEGQFAWMAHIGPDGRLTAYEQVLTGEKFATIKIDQATKADVLRTIGHPAQTSYLSLRDLEVWSYRYKEAGVWNSLMHVHFDRNGIVRQMINGPDPRYQDQDRHGR
ncbi:MAG: hypothetical protein ACJ8LG_09455 [Massilia sp.]